MSPASYRRLLGAGSRGEKSEPEIEEGATKKNLTFFGFNIYKNSTLLKLSYCNIAPTLAQP